MGCNNFDSVRPAGPRNKAVQRRNRMNSQLILKRLTDNVHMVALGLALLAVYGCGAGRTLVIKPPELKLQASSVNVSEGNSMVRVPSVIKVTFQKIQTISL